LIELAVHGFVAGCRRPVPFRLAGLVGQFVDGVDRRLHLLVSEDHGAEHDFLGQFLGFRFDHQHGRLRAGDDQIELLDCQLVALGLSTY
jgi:hypothetical protein